jgi:hypothetical protein
MSLRSAKYQLPSILANTSRYRSQCDHDLSEPLFGEDVVGDGVALSRGAVALERDRALSVEVHRGLVAVQVGEDRGQRLTPLQDVRRLVALPVHVDGEDRVVGEQRFLPLGVAPVGAMRVGVEQLADRQAIGGLGRREVSVGSHRSSLRFGWRAGRAVAAGTFMLKQQKY